MCTYQMVLIPVFDGKLHNQHFAALQSPSALLASVLASALILKKKLQIQQSMI